MCSVYTIYAASSPCGGTVSTTRAHRRTEKSQSAGQGDRNPDSTLPFLCVCHTVTKFVVSSILRVKVWATCLSAQECLEVGPVQVLSPLVPLHLCQRFSEQKLIKYIFLVLVVNWFTGHLLAPFVWFQFWAMYANSIGHNCSIGGRVRFSSTWVASNIYVLPDKAEGEFFRHCGQLECTGQSLRRCN